MPRPSRGRILSGAEGLRPVFLLGDAPPLNIPRIYLTYSAARFNKTGLVKSVCSAAFCKLMNRLAGKRILITGASRGLGRQLAIDFVREGAEALALIARHPGPLKGVGEEIRKVGPNTKVLVVDADVSRPEDVVRA